MINVKQIKVDVLEDNYENILKKVCKKLNTSKDNIVDYKIIRQSLDARDKNNIYYVYELDVKLKNEKSVLNKSNKDISVAVNREYKLPIHGIKKMKTRPVIIGSGPAGLFCALILAEAGYKPIIFERGERMEERVNTVNKFWNDNKLNPNSNVQFGEGGAGTFSDGKLNTLVHNENNRHYKVLKTFVECGANEDILFSYKPHIGTDLLRSVIINLRNKIISLGGEIYYNSCLNDIEINDGEITSITVGDKKIECGCLILAIGHSARDTFKMLNEKNINMVSKPFAVGLRVQHPQKMIDISQYGEKYAKILNKASYKLTYQSKSGRGIYSFCMCPGGYVVNASSEVNRLAINGMSNNERESENANSAIVVTIGKEDYGNGLFDGLEFQRTLEEQAYKIGNGVIPVQLFKDYKNNRVSDFFEDVKPIFKGDYQFSNLNLLFNDEINNDIKESFSYFGNKIKGFDRDDAILAGIESRTSSPIRILRNDNLESNILGIYPCGEGAGYAGGITSAAMDGIKVAEAIINEYSNIL